MWSKPTARIPAIGLGTMTLKGAVCVEAVKTALRLGYRHIDTAGAMATRPRWGRGCSRAARRRSRPRGRFVTTKVYHDKLAAADFQRSFDDSLAKLKLPWVDLLLIHWPTPAVPLEETLGVLCKARREGRARHVGVANFPTRCSSARPSSRASLWSPIRSRCIRSSIKAKSWRRAAAVPRGDRLLPARPRQGAGQRRARAHWQGARQEPRRSRCAISSSRASCRFRAPPIPTISPPIWRCSTSS